MKSLKRSVGFGTLPHFDVTQTTISPSRSVGLTFCWLGIEHQPANESCSFSHSLRNKLHNPNPIKWAKGKEERKERK